MTKEEMNERLEKVKEEVEGDLTSWGFNPPECPITVNKRLRTSLGRTLITRQKVWENEFVYGDFRIEVIDTIAEKGSHEELLEVIMHEYVHVLTPWCRNHGQDFLDTANKINVLSEGKYNIGQYANFKDAWRYNKNTKRKNS